MLIENGANVGEPEGTWKRTPLHFIAQIGPPYVAQLLIDKGANVNARDTLGDTPLHYASLSNQVDIARLLLEHGADPEVPGLDPITRAPGITPARLAKEQEMRDLFARFTQKGKSG